MAPAVFGGVTDVSVSPCQERVIDEPACVAALERGLEAIAPSRDSALTRRYSASSRTRYPWASLDHCASVHDLPGVVLITAFATRPCTGPRPESD